MEFKNYLFFLTLISTLSILVSVTGCSNKESNEGSSVITLIANDSIKIDVLNEINAFDYDSENDVFLLGDVADATSIMMPPGMAPEGNKLGFMIINNKGEILGQFNNTGEGPINHGIGAMNSLFLDNDRIGVFSQKGFFVYDFQGNLLGHEKALNTLSFTGQPTYNISAFQSGNLALGYTKITQEASGHWDSLYRYADSFKIFEVNGLLVSDKDIDEHVIQSYDFPDEIADKNIGEFTPRITLNKERGVLNVLFSMFHKLHQYSISDGSLLNVIDLKPFHFNSDNEYPAKDRDELRNWFRNGGELMNSSYHDMVQIGEYTLIRYSSAISRTEAETLVNSGGPSKSEYWGELRQTSYKFYYLLIKGDKIIKQDFQLEELIPQPGEEYFRNVTSLRGQLIGGNNLNSLYILYNNDYAEEREYKLIVKYQLKID